MTDIPMETPTAIPTTEPLGIDIDDDNDDASFPPSLESKRSLLFSGGLKQNRHSLLTTNVPTILPTTARLGFDDDDDDNEEEEEEEEEERFLQSSVPSDNFSDSPSAVVLPPSPPIAVPTIGTETVMVTIDNVRITFTGISMISVTDVEALQIQLEIWFETYLNEDITANMEGRYRILMRHQDHRDLQQPSQFRVPEVRNVATTYNMSTQDTTTFVGSNIITWTQFLTYDMVSGSGTNQPQQQEEDNNSDDILLLPFMNSTYKDELIEVCRTNIDSFANLSAISTPIIAESVDVDSSGSLLSTGAIIGIVVAGILGVALMVGIFWKFMYQQNDRRPLSSSDNRIEPTNVQQSDTQPLVLHEPTGIQPQQQQQQPQQPQVVPTSVTAHLVTDPPARSSDYVDVNFNENFRSVADPPVVPAKDYVVTYKDQSRSVIASTSTTPVVQAIPRPRNDTSVLPIVTAVPYQTPKPPPRAEG